jgi:drug/metabolite transporter (DMT)-like permease
MRPRVLLLSAGVIWGWTFVATRILLAKLGLVEIFALRLAIGLPVLGGVLLVRRVPLRFAPADAAPLLLGSAVFTLHFLVQLAGLVTATATNAGWIISVSPLALAVLSFLFLCASG